MREFTPGSRCSGPCDPRLYRGRPQRGPRGLVRGIGRRARKQVAEHWLPIADTIVDETDGRVRGLLSLIGNGVGAVFVHHDHQRSGIGRALMDRARASWPFLELDVFEPTGHIELSLRPG